MKQLMALLLLSLSIAQGGMQEHVANTSLGGNLYLVNRNYMLAQEYEPADLTIPDVLGAQNGLRLREEPARQLEQLFSAAKADGFSLIAVSGYRSFGQQSAIYERKIRNTGSEAQAQLWVAPPGASEHQLGLAVDLGRKADAKLAAFGGSKEDRWLQEHAHEFGFIIRYKAAWMPITGYADEPWHIRYVGIEHASELVHLDMPLETYIELLGQAMYGEYLADETP